MSLCIFGEVGIDVLMESTDNIWPRWGGAGLYASISAAKQGIPVEFLTAYGPELDQLSIGSWTRLGVSFNHAKYEPMFTLPKYLVTGYKKHEKKISSPLTWERIGINFSPSLPPNSTSLIVFPFNHSLPLSLCEEAFKNNVPVFIDPKPNELSIDDAKRALAFCSVLLVNEEEARRLSGEQELPSIITKLRELGAKDIIIKRGIRGCLVCKADGVSSFPAFKSNAVCTLGSGDVFAGAFAVYYMETQDIIKSAELASCIAANFIEKEDVEQLIGRNALQEDYSSRPRVYVPDVQKNSVYLAGPFFSDQEWAWVNIVCSALEQAGFHVGSPSRENGILSAGSTQNDKQDVFNADINLVERAQAVIALVDHGDPGTSFEIGFAYKSGIPVFSLQTSADSLNNMISGGSRRIFHNIDDLIEGLYEYFKDI
jgi:sugar/nucleoside kinase (ribokinase family)/nucleoside 2-deoxyribosyltransferase